MRRNIEIKARVADLARLERTVRELGAEGPTEIVQEDSFYLAPKQRLKLRRYADGTGHLISYHRPDGPDPAPSHYVLAPTTEPEALHEALATAVGVRGIVRKVRHLWMVDRTRVHLDEVEGLGSFMELEVVLRDGEEESDGVTIAHDLMRALDIHEEDLIDDAYIDLLERQGSR